MPTYDLVRSVALLFITALCLTACNSDSKAPSDQQRATAGDSVGSGTPNQPAAPLHDSTSNVAHSSDPLDRANAPVATPGDTSVQWVMSDSGITGLTVGSSRADVEKRLGIRLEGADTTSPCIQLRSVHLPQGVSFMFTGGKLARIDVDYPTVATSRGARVGDSKEKIESLYPGEVKVTPHKYLDGNYLTVRPKKSKLLYVFETENDIVRRYRFGRLPEVEWVEGCQ